MSMFRLIKTADEGGSCLGLVRVRAGRLIWGVVRACCLFLVRA